MKPTRSLRAQRAIRRRRRLAAGGAAVLLVIGVTLGLALRPDNHTQAAAAKPTPTATPTTPGQAWQNHVISVDFKSLTGVVLGLDQALNSWTAKKTTSSAALTAVDHALPDIIASREALASEKPFPQAPQALDDYRSSAELYVEGAKLAQVAALLPAGALQTQEQNASLRLRDIGDSLVNQAAALLAPFLPGNNDANLTFVPTPEVPNWASLGIATGEPLDVTPPKAPTQQYDANRSQQSVAGWVAAVGRVSIPSASAEAAAILTGSTATDQAMSRQFNAAVVSIAGLADPLGTEANAGVQARAASVRVRLSLLVDSEATRAAQAAALAPAPERASLVTAAKTIALIGDTLWDARLGPRATGFPASLLVAGTSDQSGIASDH